MSFASRPNWSVGALVNPPFVGGVSDLVTDPSDASCSMAFASDGSGTITNSFGPSGFSWFSPNLVGVGGGYWIRVTVNSGATPSGSSTGAWLALTSTRTWSLARTSPGTTIADLTVEIATDAAGASVVLTFGVTMQAVVEV